MTTRRLIDVSLSVLGCLLMFHASVATTLAVYVFSGVPLAVIVGLALPFVLAALLLRWLRRVRGVREGELDPRTHYLFGFAVALWAVNGLGVGLGGAAIEASRYGAAGLDHPPTVAQLEDVGHVTLTDVVIPPEEGGVAPGQLTNRSGTNRRHYTIAHPILAVDATPDAPVVAFTCAKDIATRPEDVEVDLGLAEGGGAYQLIAVGVTGECEEAAARSLERSGRRGAGTLVFLRPVGVDLETWLASRRAGFTIAWIILTVLILVGGAWLFSRLLRDDPTPSPPPRGPSSAS